MIIYYWGLHMGVPLRLLVRRHIHGSFRGTPTIKPEESIASVNNSLLRCLMRVCVSSEIAHLCISPADVLMPRHNSKMMPASAVNRRKRVRKRKCRMALEGGNRAFVDFQVTPPLGSSMSWRETAMGGRRHVHRRRSTSFEQFVPKLMVVLGPVMEGNRCRDGRSCQWCQCGLRIVNCGLSLGKIITSNNGRAHPSRLTRTPG